MREISEEDQQDLAAFPFDEDSEVANLGLKTHHGEDGYSTLERRYALLLDCLMIRHQELLPWSVGQLWLH